MVFSSEAQSQGAPWFNAMILGVLQNHLMLVRYYRILFYVIISATDRLTLRTTAAYINLYSPKISPSFSVSNLISSQNSPSLYSIIVESSTAHTSSKREYERRYYHLM